VTLVTNDLKKGVQELHERLSSPDDPAKFVRTISIDATMTGPQTSEALWSGLKVVSDEPKSIAGHEAAPPPSWLFVASIGFAENVIFARQAAIKGVDFDSMETHLEAVWDMKGIFSIRDADPSIASILIETRVTSEASPADIAELVRLTDRRCPMTRTIAKAARVQRRLLLNGSEVPLQA